MPHLNELDTFPASLHNNVRIADDADILSEGNQHGLLLEDSDRNPRPST